MLCTTLALAVALATPAIDTTPPPRTLVELEARIRRVLDSTKTPGLALAIVRHDSVLYAGGVGLATVTPARDATGATLFRIGSTSKSIVALTALALEAEGRLSLQDPVERHLPGFHLPNPWRATDPVRLVHLLEHTAGLDDNSLKAYASSDPTPLTLAQGLALDSMSREARWRPGTYFSYSNTGPAIVARVIEVVEGRPFEDVVQSRWFTPLGMATATYFRPDTTRVAAATLYLPDHRTAVPYWHVFARPVGSINASAEDMARFLRFLLGRGTIDGRTLLPATAFDRLEHPETGAVARAGLAVGYGKHMYRTADSTGFVWTGHNGSVNTGLSDLSYLPEHGVGYAVLTNDGNTATLRRVAELVRGFLLQDVVPARPPARSDVDAATQRRFSGWYRMAAPRVARLGGPLMLLSLAHVTVTDSALVVKPWTSKALAYQAVDAHRFRRPGEPVATLALVPGDGEMPEGLTLAGQDAAPVSTPAALLAIGLTLAWLLGFVLGPLALLAGGIRRLWRRWRGRECSTAPSAIPWRLATLATVVLAVHVALLGGGDFIDLGVRSARSGGLWLAGLLYGLVSAASVAVAFRPRTANGWWPRLSLATARAVLVLHLVAATYLAVTGYLGWRTWA